MVGGLLNTWVGDMVEESFSCMRRWPKMVMKQVTAVVEKGLYQKKSAVFSFLSVATKVDG
jgi:hypothetical protein